MPKSNCCICLYAGAMCAVFGSLLTLGASAAAQKPYKVEHRWVIGGGGGSWDYLLADSPSNRLFIAHQTRVDVVDLGSGKLVGAIEGLTRCHGIVILPDRKAGFISDGGEDQVVVFDVSSLARQSTIPAGTNPDGMVYEASTHALWVFNGASKNATVIDTATMKPVATVALPGKPEFPVSDDKGTVFVNIEDSNAIVRIDANAKKMTATWPLAGCESPSGLAFDASGARLFSVCDGKKMSVTDARTGKSLGTANIGDGPDATAYDPTHKLAFSSNEDGTLTVVDAGKPNFPVVQTLATMQGARTMAFDAARGTIYTVSAKFAARAPSSNPAQHVRPTAVAGTFTVLTIGRD